MNTLNGLPVHILLVHAVVVLLPLAAALLVLCAAWPAARARFAGANALLAVGTLAMVPVTTGAGEWLQSRVKDTALVRDHADLGGTAVLVAVPVAVLAVAVWWRSREAAELAARPLAAGRPPAGEVATSTGRTLVAIPVATTTAPPRRAYLAPASRVVTRVVLALSVLAAVATVVDVYEIGDSGARASWENGFSSTPLPGR